MIRLRSWHPFVAVWFLNAAAASQNAVPPVRAATIQGIVTVKSAGDLPVENVAVWLEALSRPSLGPLQPSGRPMEDFLHVALSGPDGRFILDDVPSGEYRLYADGEGMLQQEYGQKSPELRGEIVEVRAGDRLEINFRLVPLGAISGRVIDGYGEPVPGIPVHAEMFQYRTGKYVLLDLRQVRLNSGRRLHSVSPGAGYSVTDADGAYRLAGLPPGDYSVVVRHPGRESIKEGFNDIVERPPFAPVYYPEALTAAAGRIAIAGSEVSGIDIRWNATPPVSVRGEVLGYEGNAPLLLSVATSEGVAVSPMAIAMDQGRFELILPPFQTYVIESRVAAGGSGLGTTRIDVTDEDLEGVNVILEPPIVVNGQIIPAPGSEPPDLRGLSVELRLGLDLDSLYSLQFSVVQPDGTFRFERFPRQSGAFRLSLRGLPPGYYLESAVFGSVDILKDGLDPSTAGSGNILTIRVGSTPGQITGRVVNARGNAQPGVRVTLVPGGSYTGRYDRYLSAFTDADGRFRIQAVPPGPYQVFAWATIPIDAEMNQDFLALYRAQGRSVRIEQAGTVEIEVRVIDQVH